MTGRALGNGWAFVLALRMAVRGRGRAVAWLALWGMVEAVPVLVFGRAAAGAIDGFLAGRLGAGLGWLGVLSVAALTGAVASGRMYGPLAAVVEPFRDSLVRRVVQGAVHGSVRGGRRDHSAVARLTHQAEIVRDSLAGALMVASDAVFTLAGALIGLATLLPLALPLVLLPLLAGLALFLGIVPRVAARQRELVLAEEQISAAVVGLAEGLRDVVACGADDVMAAEVGGLVDAQAATARSLARLGAVRAAALAIGGRLPLLLLLVAAPWLLRHGASLGAVLGAMTYVMRGLEPALHTAVRGIGGSGLRLTVTLDRVLTADQLPPAPAKRRGITTADLRLRHLTFAYGPQAEPVIRDLTFELHEGGHLAIVGPSGIGKSTLAALMAGIMPPGAGSIRLGDVAAVEVDPQERVLIPQEAYVFAGTLRENLTYLRPEAMAEDIERASAAFKLGPLVGRLGGYDTAFDAADLSAGERQLIALARAYLSNARLVVLDEATCHLDPAAEAQAEQAFAARPGTLVVIAHRMSSARRAQRILVLDGIREYLGTHEELLTSCALYRDLCGHWSQPAGVVGDTDGIDTVPGTDLADDAGHVIADRSDRQAQPSCDFSV